MSVLTDAELRMVAEVVSELAKLRRTSFDKAAMGFSFARAALIDPAFNSQAVAAMTKGATVGKTYTPAR